MNTTLKIAMAQIAPVWLDKKATLNKIENAINELDEIIRSLTLQRDFLRALQKSDIESQENSTPQPHQDWILWLMTS